ncbi:MAG: hypothetical protein WCJ40_14665 [Planctomycetota bacterium]
MFYEFYKPEILPGLFNPNDFLPNRKLGLLLLIIGLAAGLILIIASNTSRRKPAAWWSAFGFAASILLVYSGLHVFTSGYIDEVFVNLEHPWNLFHHGIFSFDPVRIVDGTVEMLYYIALTPFSQTHGSLVRANYIFGFLLGLGHLLLWWSMLSKVSGPAKWMISLIILNNISMVACFSNGFGNLLVSFVVLLAVWLDQNRRRSQATYLIALLPLIRIDAALVTAWFLISIDPTWTGLKRIKRPIALSALCLISVLVFCHLYYGHAVSTPILFKSGLDLALSNFLQPAIWVVYLREFGTYFHLLSFLVMACACFNHNLSPFYLRLAAFGLPIQIFYWLSARSQYFDVTRYWLSVEVVWATITALMLQEFVILYHLQLAKSPQASNETTTPPLNPDDSRQFKTIILPMVLCFWLVSCLFSKIGTNGFVAPIHDLPANQAYTLAAHLTNRTAPPDWKIAVHELNGFGYLLDRPVIDLWGYTNRTIASSKIRNLRGVKSRPETFLDESPELHWSLSGSALLQSSRESLEEFLVNVNNWNWQLNQLGDLTKVFQKYDAMLVRESDILHLFLIRKDRSRQWAEALEHDGFKQVSSKAIDPAKLRQLVDHPQKQIHPFSTLFQSKVNTP